MALKSTNPYITGKPIGKDMPFYGREAEFDWIAQTCIRGEHILILHGVSRIGKTSLLYQLPYRLTTDFVVVYVDLRPEATHAADSIMWSVAKSLARQLTDGGWMSLPEPGWEEFLTQSSRALPDMLARIERELGGKRLIVALDSVDALLATPEGEANLWALTASLSQDLNQLDKVHLLFVGDGADRLQGPRPPRFERAVMRRLSSLSMNAASSLVIEPSRDRISFEPPAVRRVIELASGHPYYIQLICQAIFEEAVETTWTVSLRDVERVLDRLLEGHIEEFETIWEASTSSERIVLTALGTIKGNYGVSTRQEVGNALRRENINITQDEVTDNLEYLVARGVLERLGAMTYRFRVDLMRNWLRRRKSIVEAAVLLGQDRRSEEVAVGTLRNIVLGAVGLAAIVLLVVAVWLTKRNAEPTSAALNGRSGTPAATQQASPVPAAGPTATSTPQPTPTRPRIHMRSLPTIAYFAREDAKRPWQIWVMANDGKDPMQLTDTPWNETSPVWSPDGTRVAFVSERDGNREVYVMDADGRNPIRLTKHPADDWMPVWSPDGKEIAFVSRRDGNWEIYTIKPDGTGLKRLTETDSNNWTPAYSPDGQEMVFASNRDGDWEIYVMNRDGAMPVRLTQAPGNDFSPAWSPRGDKIVFESTRDGNAEIYVMNRDGSDQVNLSRASSADDHWPAWSPDGSRIAFQSNREGDFDVFVMTVDGTNVTNLTRNRPGSKQGPHWRP